MIKGIIGGLFLFHLHHMKSHNWLLMLDSKFEEFLSTRDGWYPKLNDQDVFNAVFSIQPDAFRVLSCDWNVQIHARINTLIACSKGIDFHWYSNNGMPVRFEDIPLNCVESERRKIFSCTKKAKILHFMAQSYKAFDAFQYYSHFWRTYEQLSWTVF